MRKISCNDFPAFIPWAGRNESNQVYPLSIAEGFQPGEIYVEEGRDGVEAAFFWHYCGFGYITGKASEDFLFGIYQQMVSPPQGRRLVLITGDEDVVRFFQGKAFREEVSLGTRIEYSYPLETISFIPALPDGFEVQEIDGAIVRELKGRIIPSFSWEDLDEFLEKGFGYVALREGRICASAFSAAISSGEVDIGVETREEVRGRGLATALALHMCQHILKVHKRPVWAHGETNEGSRKTALKCGFVPLKKNTIIRKKD